MTEVASATLSLSIDSDRPNEYWGVALLALQQALSRNGTDSELRLTFGLAEALQAVADGQVDVGCNFREILRWAFDGLWQPRSPELRAICKVSAPRYIGVAATEQSGIVSLEQIAAERRPVRMATIPAHKPGSPPSQAYVVSRMFELAGFSHQDVLDWGGQVLFGGAALTAIRERQVDLIAGWAFSNWAPNWGPCWMYGQILLDLRFLPIPNATLEAIGCEIGVRTGHMPAGLFRGLEQDMPTLVYPDQVFHTHAGLSDEQAYALAKAIDDHSQLLQEGFVPFAYNPLTAWRDTGIPLHPGAAEFFRERGYMTERLTDR